MLVIKSNDSDNSNDYDMNGNHNRSNKYDNDGNDNGSIKNIDNWR